MVMVVRVVVTMRMGMWAVRMLRVHVEKHKSLTVGRTGSVRSEVPVAQSATTRCRFDRRNRRSCCPAQTRCLRRLAVFNCAVSCGGMREKMNALAGSADSVGALNCPSCLGFHPREACATIARAADPAISISADHGSREESLLTAIAQPGRWVQNYKSQAVRRSDGARDNRARCEWDLRF